MRCILCATLGATGDDTDSEISPPGASLISFSSCVGDPDVSLSLEIHTAYLVYPVLERIGGAVDLVPPNGEGVRMPPGPFLT